MEKYNTQKKRRTLNTIEIILTISITIVIDMKKTSQIFYFFKLQIWKKKWN